MKIVTVLLFVYLFLSDSIAQPDQVKFMHLNSKNGLIGNTVHCIFQDSRNFIWFGTDAGLNRFDGYDFRIFKSVSNNYQSISSNYIRTIAEDDENNLWIGTDAGLNRFNRSEETFKRFITDTSDSTTISYNYITCIKKHPSGKLYVGTGGGGICVYNKDSENFTNLKFYNKNNKLLSTSINDIICLPDGRVCFLSEGATIAIVNPEFKFAEKVFENPGGEGNNIGKLFFYQNYIYAGTSNSIIQISLKDYSIRRFPLPEKNEKLSGLIVSIDVDENGILWFGSTSSGIFLFNTTTSQIVASYNYNEYDPASLSGSDISSVLIDNTNKVWIGTWGAGINYYHPEITKFEIFNNTLLNPHNLPGNKINDIFQDRKNNIWIGTEKGLAKYSYTNGQLQKSESFAFSAFKNLAVMAIYEDSRENLWIGSFTGGLAKINISTNSISKIHHNTTAPKVRDILEIEPGVLWITTSGNGLLEYRISSGTFKSIYTSELNKTFLTKIVQDNENNIWLGSAYGLIKINNKTTNVVKYFHQANDTTSLANNHIFCLKYTVDGHLIIGTSSGINIYDKNANSFQTINFSDGLQDDYIYSIEEDKYNRLWVSSLKGLSCLTITSYSPLIFSIINYSGYDGLQTEGFRHNASLKLNTGELFFGGNSGVNFFNPDNIHTNKYLPHAIINNFQLFNQEIFPNELYNNRVVLSKAITETKKIVLKSNENVLTFGFSALNAIVPEKCEYKYKLDGFEKNWNFVVTNTRKITYTNLDPGEYLLKIRASNGDGIWNDDGTKLKIIVLPPFWKTKWAIILYILSILTLLFFLRKIVILRERRIAQEKLEVQEARRIHEMDVLKIRFFTNVSHEFRTPLTLIITPIEKLLKELKYKELEQPLQTIHRNSRRLLNLVNQLLDFRKMEVSGIKLSPTTGNIIEFIKEMVVTFTDLAEKKNVTFKFRSNIKELIMQFDHDKMEKIIFNLLSNAFKYTLEKGEIVVTVDFIEQFNLLSGEEKNNPSLGRELQIKVKDTGIGIPADKINHVFERFIQADNSNKIIEHGSGIGLSLTYEFVKMHGGEIWVESEEGKGSCFTFTLPVEFKDNADTSSAKKISFENKQIKENKIYPANRPVVLLVEDNEDLRLYLRDNLNQKYTILEAGNGKLGIELAVAEMPDLIISDIMMPELDGLELCKQLKNQTDTSHIPIILLTAKTSEEQQMAGFEFGADAYITKPFSFEILEMQIKNLIDQRKHLKSIFNKKINISPSDISVTSLDEKLIKKALEVVELNISNPDFSVEQLGRELGMSRVHLYKKLLSLTGKSPIEFIRVLRLKRAAQLLQKSQLRVSEIAYEVGFNNPKYFSKYFKEEFNMLPSEYASNFFKNQKNT